MATQIPIEKEGGVEIDKEGGTIILKEGTPQTALAIELTHTPSD